MLERNTLGNVNGQCNIKYTVSYTFQIIGQVQAFDIQCRINKKIHVVLINNNQYKSYWNEKFETLTQDYLAVEYNCCSRENTDKYTPVDGYRIQVVVMQNGSHELALQNRRGGKKQTHREEQEQNNRKVAVTEYLGWDIRAAHCAHAVDVDEQAEQGNDDTGAYFYTV